MRACECYMVYMPKCVSGSDECFVCACSCEFSKVLSNIYKAVPLTLFKEALI